MARAGTCTSRLVGFAPSLLSGQALTAPSLLLRGFPVCFVIPVLPVHAQGWIETERATLGYGYGGPVEPGGQPRGPDRRPGVRARPGEREALWGQDLSCSGPGSGRPPEQPDGRQRIAAKRPPGCWTVFIQRGRAWTDIAHADRISITEIAAYSRAYFDLVRQLPEVAPYLSVGAEVLIGGRRQSIRIAPSGIEVWGPGQLGDLVRNFRGT